MSSSSADNQLHNETTRFDSHHDLEKGAGLAGGAELGRQISVQLTSEQFERLYLQPGGVGGKGDLAKRLGNPTPLGVASFLLCLTPFSCELMGWGGTTTGAAVTTVGAYYFVGGLGLTLSGIFEWIVGNTFPATVFITFGGFWFAFGFLLDPTVGIAATLGANSIDYNAGIGIYLIWWAMVVLVYFIASLRTNVVFVLLFFFLEITFDILIGLYFNIANARVANIEMVLKAGGAFAFLTCICGWYLFLVLILGSTGVPLQLPVGDLSNFMTRCKKDA